VRTPALDGSMSSLTKPRLPILEPRAAFGQIALKNWAEMPLIEGRAGARFLNQLALLEEAIATYRSRIKELLKQYPESIPHWEMRPGASVREIHGGALKVRQAIGEELDDEQFLDACKISFRQLELAFQEAQSLDKAAAALKVNRLLETAGLVTIRQNQPSLKHIWKNW